jgi:CO/xanthine dehydrogenase FAD-binding subunit
VIVLIPSSLSHACELMAEHAGALTPIAGATDLLVHWPVRIGEHDKAYVDLSKLSELRRITWADDRVTFGAMSTYWDAMTDPGIARELPLLIDAARQVGAVQIQARGTWAGNIANGSPAADGVPALMALGASVILASKSGTRSVPLDAYYTGYRQSVCAPDELIVSITMPRRAYDISQWHKVGPRNAQAITKVGLAITREAATGVWRVVANSVAPTVRRCPAIEALLTSRAPITSPDGFLIAARRDVAPIDDIRSTADYRMTVLCRLIYHSLRGRIPSIT